MKKKIIIVLDAFPFEKIKNNNQFNIIFKKLETIPGYSDGIYPSIWTGLTPAQTNFWSPFKFIEKKIIKEEKRDFLLKILSVLKNIPYKINPYVSFSSSLLFNRIMKKAYPFPPFYNFTLDQVFYYENYQDYIMDPKKFNIHQTSIFSLLKENLINFNYIFSYEFGIHYEKLFEKSKNDVIFYLNPILDYYGHNFGIHSKDYNAKLFSLLEWINKLITEDKYDLIIFSDHGMTDIYYHFHPIPIFKKLDIKLNKDVIIWLDSTMVRIWLLNEKAKQSKEKIIENFMNQKAGFFYNSELRDKYGLNFPDRAYGDLIFQVDPYYEVFPNFFNYLKFIPTKGMHGYIPSHKDSYGVFYSSENNDNPNNVLEIFNYLKQKIL